MDDSTRSAPRLAAALAYVRRGWPVVLLHDVHSGACTCGDNSDKHRAGSAGKHPVAKAWTEAAVTDEQMVQALWTARPYANVGILTGTRAGMWVLDIDPKNGGNDSLAALQGEHGLLPPTYTVRTGGGGTHYYFLMPAEFVVGNRQRSGSIAAGIDVRGQGGQVVASTSETLFGHYELLLDLPLAQAPVWLLDMLRPRVPTEIEHSAAVARLDSSPLAGGDRLTRYAQAVIAAECEKLAGAAPGGRNNQAFDVACNLIELVNSPWASVSEQAARHAFAQAARMLIERTGGDFDEAEAWACWQSAARRVGGRGRLEPDALPGGVLLGWGQLPGGVPPFSATAPLSSSMDNVIHSPVNIGSAPVDNLPQFDISSADPVGISMGSGGNPAGQTVPMGIPTIPNGQLGQGLSHDPVAHLLSKFLSVEELGKLPAPSWLVDGWLVRDSLAWVSGEPGSYKSFLALSLALCVATGTPWYGARVAGRGRVGYIVAEGASGMNLRVMAWNRTFHQDQADLSGIRFLPEPVQAADLTAWNTLISAASIMRLDLIVLDTQARITVGMRENDPQDMGILVEQAERLRRATGACVLLIHHVPKGATTLRGHSSLEGAANTILGAVKAADGLLTVSVRKQKDDAPPVPLSLRLHSVAFPELSTAPQGWSIGPAEPARVPSGGVLRGVDVMEARQALGLTSKERLVHLMKETFPERGCTKAELRKIAADRAGMATSSFYRAWDDLVSEGVIARVLIDDRPTSSYIVKPVEERQVKARRDIDSRDIPTGIE